MEKKVDQVTFTYMNPMKRENVTVTLKEGEAERIPINQELEYEEIKYVPVCPATESSYPDPRVSCYVGECYICKANTMLLSYSETRNSTTLFESETRCTNCRVNYIYYCYYPNA